jgi:hypothetical protein
MASLDMNNGGKKDDFSPSVLVPYSRYLKLRKLEQENNDSLRHKVIEIDDKSNMQDDQMKSHLETLAQSRDEAAGAVSGSGDIGSRSDLSMSSSSSPLPPSLPPPSPLPPSPPPLDGLPEKKETEDKTRAKPAHKGFIARRNMHVFKDLSKRHHERANRILSALEKNADIASDENGRLIFQGKSLGNFTNLLHEFFARPTQMKHEHAQVYALFKNANKKSSPPVKKQKEPVSIETRLWYKI